MTLGYAWGSNWAYFGKHVSESLSEATNRGVKQDYYSRAVACGEPPGRWLSLGLGANRLGLAGEVTSKQMEMVYGGLVNPATGECLGTALRHYASPAENLIKVAERRGVRLSSGVSPQAVEAAISAGTMTARDVEDEVARHVQPETLGEMKREAARAQRHARNFIDMVFSPDKSLTVMQVAAEAAGRIDIAEVVDDAHQQGVEAGLAVLLREACLARAGYHGKKVGGRTSGRWVQAPEWVIASFTHHLSREGDPHLHTHVAVLNRALCEDEVWRSHDGEALVRARPLAAAVYERTSQEAVSRGFAALGLGVRFVTSPDGESRRVVGVDQETIDLFSKRTAVINARVEEWKASYRDSNDGAEPDERRIDAAAAKISRATRKPKPEKMDARDQSVRAWDAELTKVRRTSLKAVLKDVTRAGDAYRRELRAKPLAPIDREAVCAEALGEVGRLRSRWNRYHLAMEINRALPDDLGGLSGEQVDSLIDGLTETALRSSLVAQLNAPDPVGEIPAELLRSSDGRSIYAPHDDMEYALHETLSREQSLLSRALETGAPAMDNAKAERRLADAGLRADQHAAVLGCLTSGRSLEVVIGPAGTGKSYAMKALADAWQRHVGRGSVVGLALSENAAKVLKDSGVKTTANIERWLLQGAPLPQGALVIVDEASMVSTEQLSRIEALVRAAGGKMLLTGDDHQLGGIESAGVMALIAGDATVRRSGAVHELQVVARFKAEWEREASLRLRRGDAEVLDLYDRHGRIASGDLAAMTTQAYESFVTDVLSGKKSLLLVPTEAQASELSTRVRNELVALGLVDNSRTTTLRDKCVVGAGDVIQARLNDRLTRDSKGVPVSNRDVFLVASVLRDGGLVVCRDLGRNDDGEQMWGKPLVLNSDYCAEHVQLAYASTIYAAQGRTVDSCHSLVDSRASREALYVETTRGRSWNGLYVVTEYPENDSLAEPPEVERDPMVVLREVLDRTSATVSATAAMREQFDASESLARLGPIWSDVCGRVEANAHTEALGAALSPTLAGATGELRTKVSLSALQADPAYPALMRVVAHAADMGHDPAVMLRTVVGQRELETAGSVAEVLHWRVVGYLQRTPARPAHAVVPSDRRVEQVVAAMSPGRRETLRSDPALPALVALTNFAAGEGVEVDRLVAEAEASRGFDDALSVAEVMHYRVKASLERSGIEVPEHLDSRTPERPPRLTYLERTPEPASLLDSSLAGDALGVYARRVAAVMDERVAALGERVAVELPEWATANLGPLPDDVMGRETWVRRAGLIEAYREQYVEGELPIQARDPIGSAPSRFLSPDRYETWRLANDALGDPDRGRDVSRLSDPELRHRVQTWRKLEERAPEHKGVELRHARERLRRLERDHQRSVAILRGAELGPRMKDQAAELEVLRSEVENLDQVQEVRDEWWRSVAPEREAARYSGEELRRRHPGLADDELLHPEEMSALDLRRYERQVEHRLEEPTLTARMTGLKM